MNKKTIRLLKIIIPLFLGIFLIWYSLGSATPEERQQLWESILAADKTWVALSFLLGTLSHMSRAWRWQYMLEPMGYQAGFKNRFMAVMVAYLANFGIPRSGEVLRAVTLTTYDDIPFEKGFGTIISERVADLFILIAIVLVAIFLQTDDLLAYLHQQNINPLYTFLIFFGLVGIIILGLNLVRRSTWKPFAKIRKLAKGLLEGMRSILTMEKKWAFLGHTVFIWTMYVWMFYVIKFCLPETASVAAGSIMAAFVVGSFAVSATNGGIGVYPLAVAGILIFFGVPDHAAEAFGWISWATQTFVVLVFGGLSFILLPVLNNRK
ncbi:lysylphosphatidylglycerol synthase transmembrane domain-containing protein [Christiangramia flava]|uniref:Putative dolichol-P-glucose synthetase n=1 Tax=Christiangramia flava JLT2011 TaxID=1229726 RepID=A0A1L7I4A7_9FLAO|nr:lysylphosphatidylglycerol synthase transmembrane domain-containing protein [Christiangramia flava]APU68426.1 putative dolichol-P-glucose synthetase [Christiangramia flava JLT2011]OSS40786.1 putative dolichol-P-glucose synthetase [Christiangramia flava JLT2011]